MNDSDFMRQAMALAERGRGWVSPNPLVGAVIVRDGEIVGRGYHRRVGGPHAEVDALRMAGSCARGATLYVNLEPCCHHGRTPPCTDAIARAGIRRVVASVMDPNPLVKGGGFRALRRAGIQVRMGLLAKEALRLNEWYVKRTVTGLPFVILKIAATLDGKIATRSRESAWISSEQARAFSHRLRSRVDAVFTGIGTVRGDDPRLTARHGARPYRRQPARIVADSHLTISSRARVLGTGRAIIATTTAAPRSRLRRLEDRGVEVWSLRATRAGEVSLRAVLERAGSEGLTSILVEGGEHLNASLLKGRLVDKILVFLAPKVMGGGGSVDAVGDLGVKHLRQVLLFRDLSVRKLGPDVVVEAYVVKNHRPLAFGH